ncbi:MAG: hypothetical protein AAF502_05170 [Bacteroidota bacterium]
MKSAFKILTILIFSVWLGIPANGQSSGSDLQVNLTGTIRSNSVLLYWDVYGWSFDLYGFNIKRKAAGAEEWDLLNQMPISPEFSPMKNWSLQGLNQSQINQYMADYGGFLQSMNMNAEQSLSSLQQNNGILTGDRLSMHNDFGLALTMGFGYIDNNYVAGAQFEYAIFFVRMDGSEVETPLSILKLSNLMESNTQLDANISFVLAGDAIRVEWTVDRPAAARKGLVGYNLYRNGALITPTPVAPLRREGNTNFYAFIDVDANNRQNNAYEVKPVNAFQEELGISTQPYRADDHLPMKKMVIGKPEMDGDVNVRITWDPKTIDKRIKKLTLQRKLQDVNDFEELASDLNKSKGSFIDDTPLIYGKVYQYALVGIDHLERSWSSNIETILYMGLVPPAPLTGLEGDFFQEASQYGIMLSWDPPSGNGPRPTGYKILTDELRAERMLESNQGLATENQAKYYLMGETGRKISVKVIPMTANGAEGEGMTIEVHIPIQKMPSVNAFTAKLQPDNSVIFTWEYEAITDLKGFELFQNDQKVAGREKMGTSSRTYTLPKAKANQNGFAKFELRAIGQGIYSKKTLAKTLKLHKISDLAGVKAPTGLKSKLVRKDGKLFAELTWAATDLAGTGIKGYALFADYKREGSVFRLSSIPMVKGNSFLYELPDNQRQQYTIRVAPVDTNNQLGPYAETILKLSN